MSCETNCPDRTTETPSGLSGFVRLAKHACYSIGDGIINLYLAIKDVAAAIREYTDRVQEKGYASSFIHFSYDGGTVDPLDEVEVLHAKLPFNCKVIGIGASSQSFTGCGGAYVANSIIEVRFWDFTAGKQVGNKLTLTASSLHDKYTNDGLTIDDNIYPGHVYGAKVKYLNDEDATCNLPLIDMWLIVVPVDVITEE